MARRNFVAPDGAVYSIEDTDQPLPGWRPETPNDVANAEAANQPAQAAGEGFARTATFGLSDHILPTLPIDVDTDGLRRRKKQNPVASAAGEVGGMFTSAPKAAMSLGAKVGAGFASKGVGRAVAGTVEGGLFGLGAVISEEAIGDSKLTADNVVAGVMGGALLGAGMNPVFGKIGDISKSALIKAFGGRALTGSLEEMAEASIMRSVTKPSDLNKRSLRGRVNEVGRFALDEGFAKGAPSHATASARASARAKDAYRGIEEGLEVADSVGHYDPTSAAKRLEGLAASLEKNPAAKGARAKILELIDDLTIGPRLEGQAAAQRNKADVIEGSAEALNAAFKPDGTVDHAVDHALKVKELMKQAGMTREEAERLAGAAERSITPTTFRKAYDTLSGLLESVPVGDTKGLKRVLFKARGEMQNDLFEQIARVDPKLGQAVKQANRDYGNAATFRDLSMKRADEVAYGNQAGGMMGMLAGVGAVAHAGPVGLAAPFAVKVLRERGGFVMGSALDALAKSGALPKIAKGFQMTMRVKLGDPNFGGVFRATLETAAANGAMDLLETHLQLSNDPEYMATVGLEHEDPTTASAYADKAHRLSNLSNAVDSTGAEIDKSIDALLTGDMTRSTETHRYTRAEFEGLRTKLEALMDDDGSSRRALAELAPTAAGLAQMGVMQGAQYLLDTMPRDPTAGLPAALQRPWNPPKAELRQWFNRVEAVADPSSVLEAMRHNEVTPEAVAALSVVYPRLYREMQERITARLAEWKEPLDRRRRGQLSALIGDLEDPAVTQLIQAAHLRSIPPMEGGAPDGRQKIDVEKNQQTQSQRLEGK